MARKLSRRAALKTALMSAVMVGCRTALTPHPTQTVQPSSTPTIQPTQPSTLTPTPSATPFAPPVTSSPIIAISAGGAHSLALCENGKVWGWGKASNLGLSGEPLLRPTMLDGLENITFIDTDDWRSSLFVDSEGRILRAGYPDEIPELNRVDGIEEIEMARVYHDTILSIRQDGTVWVYSESNKGVIGLLGLEDVEGFEENGEFRQLPLDKIVEIFIAPHQAAFIRENATVWLWGEFAAGFDKERQSVETLFVKPPQRQFDAGEVVDVAFGRWYSILRSDGSVWDYPFHILDSPRQLAQSGIAQIEGCASMGYSLMVDTDGVLWGWGNNGAGQIALSRDHDHVGIPMKIPLPVAAITVSAGNGYVLVLDVEGTVWSWGSNYLGRLGIGDIPDQYILEPIRVLRSKASS